MRFSTSRLGDATRGPVFAPRWGSYLGRLEQQPADTILGNAQRLCNSLLRAQKLFDLDAICVDLDLQWLDPVLQDIKGGPPFPDLSVTRGPVAREALQFLGSAVPAGVGLIGVLPGPRNLALHLFGADTELAASRLEWCLEMLMVLGRQYGELDCLTAIIIEERADGGESEQGAGNIAALQTLVNLLSFYELQLYLSLGDGGASPGPEFPIQELDLHGLILGGRTFPGGWDRGSRALGWAIPSELLTADKELLPGHFRHWMQQQVSLVTTEAGVPEETVLATLQWIRRECVSEK